MDKKWITKPSSIMLLALIVAVLWGSAYPALKIGFDVFAIATEDSSSKILFAGIRFFLAGLMVVAFTSLQEKRIVHPSRAELPKIAMLGLLITTGQYVFYYIGLAHCEASKAAIIFSGGIFFAVLTTPLVVKGEKLTPRKIIGCVIGFAGVIVVNGLSGGSGITLLGEVFMFIASLCFGIGSSWSKPVSAQSDTMIVTGYQLVIGGGVLILLGLIFGGKLTVITFGAVILLLYLCFISAGAFSLWTLLLKYNEAGKVLVYNFLVPVFGIALSGVFLHENVLTLRNLIALTLVCAGIIIVNLTLPGKKNADA